MRRETVIFLLCLLLYLLSDTPGLSESNIPVTSNLSSKSKIASEKDNAASNADRNHLDRNASSNKHLHERTEVCKRQDKQNMIKTLRICIPYTKHGLIKTFQGRVDKSGTSSESES